MKDKVEALARTMVTELLIRPSVKNSMKIVVRPYAAALIQAEEALVEADFFLPSAGKSRSVQVAALAAIRALGSAKEKGE